MKNLLLVLSLLSMIACSSGENNCQNFDLNHPSEIIKLPSKLKEISGITFLSKNKIACVQDEKGTVFIYDIHKDKLKESIDFGVDKDYEAIANVNDTIYVLRSNGELYEIDSLENSGQQAESYHTFLSKANNCEGLCYDSRNRRLLVACKGHPEKGSAKKYQKAVYAFDLNSKKLLEEPILVFNPDVIVDAAKKSVFGQLVHEDLFEPSEIAIEPSSGNFFILSSVGKRLAVFSPEGKLLSASNLDPEIFKQPEGLAFSFDGNLVISDEGKNGKANLVIIKKITAK